MRRYVYENYTEKKLYEGGLSVRTTLDPKMQVLARKALVDGLVNFDEQQGYRGPVNKLDMATDWGGKLADIKALGDIAPWRLAVVLEVDRRRRPHRPAARARTRRRGRARSARPACFRSKA